MRLFNIIVILVFPFLLSSDAFAVTSEAMTGNVTVDTRIIITSSLDEQTLRLRKLMTRYTVTTNFGASAFSAKGLPRGLTINKRTGLISGKPTKKGTYTVTITAQKMQGKKVISNATATKVFKVV